MATLQTKERPTTSKVTVDYPPQNAVVNSKTYSIRLGAPEGAKNVDVSIDNGQWRPCRQAVGYWWYDWSGYGEGEHEITARAETKEGKRITSSPCEFFVEQQKCCSSKSRKS